jgi:hypothetical protein
VLNMKLILSDRARVGDGDTKELILTATGPIKRVVLRAKDKGELGNAPELELAGRGYATEAEARDAALLWNGYLQFASTQVGLGADFGVRAAKGGGLSAYGARELTEQGFRVVNDDHSIIVFMDDGKTLVSKLSGDFQKVTSTTRLKESIDLARNSGVQLSERHELAIDLFGASFFQTSIDGRFVLLTMAVEALTAQEEHPAAVVEHINEMIRLTVAARLPTPIERSLTGSMRHLKRESISAAGQRAASTLLTTEYYGLSSAAFFKKCYAIRSNLVHGNLPRPSREDVSMVSATLETFAGDLISADLLSRSPHAPTVPRDIQP